MRVVKVYEGETRKEALTRHANEAIERLKESLSRARTETRRVKIRNRIEAWHGTLKIWEDQK